MTELRTPSLSEIPALARLWRDAWFDAHEALFPQELINLRTLDSFEERLRKDAANIRVAGPPDAVLGFCLIKDDELYQLFVTAAARGTGVAKTLIDDAEARLAANGVAVAFLACAIGNDRAARFYEKCGWRFTRNFTNYADTAHGPYPLECWRYEKTLKPPAPHA
jgi:ribosomal protein S18 acetylase RimI-like enzyme